MLDKMSSRGPFQAHLFSVILLQTHTQICAEEHASLSLDFHFSCLILGEMFYGVICKHSRFTDSQRKTMREGRQRPLQQDKMKEIE